MVIFSTAYNYLLIITWLLFDILLLIYAHCKPDLAIFGASMAGSCVGFLLHNRYKASVFMGYTGSLALGGALAAMAACTGMFFPLFISSGIFIVEASSIIIQVCPMLVMWLGSKFIYFATSYSRPYLICFFPPPPPPPVFHVTYCLTQLLIWFNIIFMKKLKRSIYFYCTFVMLWFKYELLLFSI